MGGGDLDNEIVSFNKVYKEVFIDKLVEIGLLSNLDDYLNNIQKKINPTNPTKIIPTKVFKSDEILKISEFILLIKNKADMLKYNISLLLGIKNEKNQYTLTDFTNMENMENIDSIVKSDKNILSFLDILKFIVDTLNIIQYNLHIVIYTIDNYNDVISAIDHTIASINDRMYLILVELDKISNHIDIYQ